MCVSTTTAGLSRSLAGERVLFRCVLVSIALHALVLIGLSEWGAPAPPARALQMLTARLAPLVAAPRAQPLPPRLAPPPNPEPASAPRTALTRPGAAPARAPAAAPPAAFAPAPA